MHQRETVPRFRPVRCLSAGPGCTVAKTGRELTNLTATRPRHCTARSAEKVHQGDDPTPGNVALCGRV